MARVPPGGRDGPRGLDGASLEEVAGGASGLAARLATEGLRQLALEAVLEAPSSPRPARPPRGRRGRNLSPLVKWPGSKMLIVKELAALAPLRFARYHEPFVGGGALFFAMRPERSFLSDLNAELVNLYLTVRDEPEALVSALGRHENTRERFYAVRGLDPSALAPVERAARTLYLNRTCFNGLYRVNGRGLFNVPYGDQAREAYFQPDLLRRAHLALRGAEISCEDFAACAERARPGDFVYLDPPYAAGLNGGPGFKYQPDGFSLEEQHRVADLFRRLDARGCLVMASNADCPLTRELYRGYHVDELRVTRFIGGCLARRGRAAEIVVRNYPGRRDALPGL